jgi:hypothetical protein
MTSSHALVPDPLQSDRQYQRFHHLDLSGLGDMELTDELHYLRPLLWGLDSEHWLRERVRMLEGEMIKRSGNTGYDFRKRQKSKPAEGVEL